MVCCAGGNTLHETACIGTPAIVWPSMPHERRTAECFERQGFCKSGSYRRKLEKR